MLQFNWGVFWAVLAALCLFGFGFLFLLSIELDGQFQSLNKALYKLQSTIDQIKDNLQRSEWIRDVFRGGKEE